jgi:hypothetical protein
MKHCAGLCLEDTQNLVIAGAETMMKMSISILEESLVAKRPRLQESLVAKRPRLLTRGGDDGKVGHEDDQPEDEKDHEEEA